MGARPKRLDLQDAEHTKALIHKADAVVLTPILTTAVSAAPFLSANTPAVFFSSNNVSIDPETAVYATLLDSESRIRKTAPSAIILRPTMIYGYPGDRNLSRLMASMQKLPITPVPGNASALQQPVFFKDLARIAAESLFDQRRRGETYAVAGPEPVALLDLYRQAAIAMAAKSAFLPVPVKFFGQALSIAEKSGLRFPFRAAQLLRASKDKTPSGAEILHGETPLDEGLRFLAAAMKKEPQEAV